MNAVEMAGLKVLTRLRMVSSMSRIATLSPQQQFMSTANHINSRRSATTMSPNRLHMNTKGLLKSDTGITWCAVRHRAGGKAKQKSKKGSKHVDVEVEDMELLVDVNGMHSEMETIMTKLKNDFLKMKVRTDIGSFEKIEIQTDGGSVPLNQIGQIAVKGSMIQINLGISPQYIKAVQKAIMTSGMNVNPQLEGNSVFIPVPKVTREHREEMAKAAKQMFNTAKSNLSRVLSKYSKQRKNNEAGMSTDLVRKVDKAMIGIEHKYRDEAEEMMKQKQKEVLNEN